MNRNYKTNQEDPPPLPKKYASPISILEWCLKTENIAYSTLSLEGKGDAMCSRLTLHGLTQ